MPYPNPIWLLDFATWLQTGGWGTIASDLFVGSLPDTASKPNAVMAVLVSPASRPADLAFGAMGEPVATTSYPRAMLFFRDAPEEYLAPMAKATHLYETLLVTVAVNVGSNHYKRFAPLQEPYPVGNRDETLRWTIAFNVEIHRNM